MNIVLARRFINCITPVSKACNLTNFVGSVHDLVNDSVDTVPRSYSSKTHIGNVVSSRSSTSPSFRPALLTLIIHWAEVHVGRKEILGTELGMLAYHCKCVDSVIQRWIWCERRANTCNPLDVLFGARA